MTSKLDALSEERLFLGEICCDLCRLHHVTEDGIPAERVKTIREFRLGQASAFADIKVLPADRPPYFVEIKWGYDLDTVLQRLGRKYGTNPDDRSSRLVVISKLAASDDHAALRDAIAQQVDKSLQVEVWDEAEVLRQIEKYFGLRLESLTGGNYQAIRQSITQAEWRMAFGDQPDDSMAPTLLWHFSASRLQKLHQEHGLKPLEILRPGNYRNVAIVMADLCSFSSYVRDTRDDALVRASLTSFYSQARQAILDSGGMIDKFVGDEVIGLFGFPQQKSGSLENAIHCARRLVDIGNSVSDHWQRHLDRVQKSGGVHVGIAVGDLNLMALRAFSNSHVGFIGDAINLTARLMTMAGPSEVVVSNSVYRDLPRALQQPFESMEPVEAKNLGMIQCWRLPSRKQVNAPV